MPVGRARQDIDIWYFSCSLAAVSSLGYWLIRSYLFMSVSLFTVFLMQTLPMPMPSPSAVSCA